VITGALLAAGASFAVLVAVFVPLERLFPARAGQPIFRSQWATDACFFLGQYLVFSAASIAVLGAASRAAAALLPSRAHGWAAGAPPLMACVVAVILGDVLVYWFHRACHAWGVLWRFHAVHHSSERLDWLAAHREHPLDGILTQLCQNLPAIALGVPMRWLTALAVFRGMWAIFVHANVRLPLGPLRFVLGAPELHRWHHARIERTTHNFANLAPWIDVVFRTYHRPTGEEAYRVGIPGAPSRAYLAHLVDPFLPGARSVQARRREQALRGGARALGASQSAQSGADLV
jgi:sterol desaturase/sphingolipid hydroxylase (fatty acid hydroxylase superfamily)